MSVQHLDVYNLSRFDSMCFLFLFPASLVYPVYCGPGSVHQWAGWNCDSTWSAYCCPGSEWQRPTFHTATVLRCREWGKANCICANHLHLLCEIKNTLLLALLLLWHICALWPVWQFLGLGLSLWCLHVLSLFRFFASMQTCTLGCLETLNCCTSVFVSVCLCLCVPCCCFEHLSLINISYAVTHSSFFCITERNNTAAGDSEPSR